MWKVAVVIPCHRVVASDGSLAQVRPGSPQAAELKATLPVVDYDPAAEKAAFARDSSFWQTLGGGVWMNPSVELRAGSQLDRAEHAVLGEEGLRLAVGPHHLGMARHQHLHEVFGFTIAVFAGDDDFITF